MRNSIKQISAYFLTGTNIATPQGEKLIEDLNIGDLVKSIDGNEHIVKWIGYRKVSPLFSKAKFQNPICIKAGAFSTNIPKRDLYVSPDHAMYLDSVLVQAQVLINGESIYQVDEMSEDFTYWHIELDSHEILLAEGAPTESFVDVGARNRYDNSAEFETLYPNALNVEPMWIDRVKFKRLLSTYTKTRLLERSKKLKIA